ncbi:DUF927 domain-containing protein [Pseudomonas lurida]|nr:DUF927 domain-containing protein [Pseudomonas lurida]
MRAFLFLAIRPCLPLITSRRVCPRVNEAGALEQWQLPIGALCAGNDCMAFAGPLLDLQRHKSGGFHL